VLGLDLVGDGSAQGAEPAAQDLAIGHRRNGRRLARWRVAKPPRPVA
jgi:hypothetical protein